MNGGPAELKMTIVAGSDPIAGHMGLPDGSSIPFQGYVQLIAALEELRDGAGEATAWATRPNVAETAASGGAVDDLQEPLAGRDA